MVVGQTRLFKRPDPLRGDRSKRFPKDIDHTTEECITLKNKIKKLIHCGYLQDYVNDKRARPQTDRLKVDPPREIQTIFDEPHFA